VGTQITDSHNRLKSLQISVNPPYLKRTVTSKNNLGLPIQEYYTTSDLCKILKISPDTFRQRLYRGYYPEPARQGNKRRFTLDQIKHIIQQTRKLINEGKLKAGNHGVEQGSSIKQYHLNTRK
jgi:hypothetical protein